MIGIRKKWRDNIQNWTNKKWILETYNIQHNWGVGKKISLAMINYLREDKLINTLQNVHKNSRMPLHITLQLQGMEDISLETKENILTELSQFKSYEVIWNNNNLGTAIPRYNTTQKTYENNSEYTIILDSDMILNYGTLELLFNKIESEPAYGIISCWCKPYYAKWYIENNKLKQKSLVVGFHETDALGTGCAIARTCIFEHIHFNTDLVIGYIDFIFCLNVRKNSKYKLGILCDSMHKIYNDSRGSSEKYLSARNNKEHFAQSKKYIKSQWNIDI